MTDPHAPADVDAAPAADPGAGYQVLARKYRPASFKDLIGQEAMVRTLRNAFAADRIHHAFVMTGVRGVGKTTTARIIAKGLNCVGPDGTNDRPTVEPCGVCEPCRAIAESRHVDVLELDAATNTQVEKMRELLAGVPYRPADARYKVYIIDEVHMLSTSSFNALLKTLEEPPAHVKFIFATTEIRKVPVTVLSRCQRFDLRRIDPETMIAFLDSIARKEGARIAPDALALIARAAEGSARDALSLLDQAIAHGGGEADAEQVRAMLGLADRGRVLDLFEAVMRGDCAAALAELGAQYAAGAEPLAVLRDLAEVTHWISVVKISPQAAEDPAIGPDERARGLELAGRLGQPSLLRMWQMLLKALDEAAAAPNAMMAAEMAIIRLTHVATMPTPAEIMRRLDAAPQPGAPAPSGGPGGGARPAGAASAGHAGAPAGGAAAGSAAPAQRAGAAPQAAARAEPAALSDAVAGLRSFDDVVALIRARRDAKLLVEVETHVRLVSYQPGRIVFEPAPEAPPSLAADLAARLQAWTGARWVVAVEGSGGGPTIRERRDAERRDLHAALMRHPLVGAALELFPGAEIREARAFDAGGDDPGALAPLAPAEDEAPDFGDADWDDWDPVDRYEE
ncbi:DNA polymerase III subunit gamma/tau [Oceanicella actignis]|uniref:DNA polymerase III subunit gamma/tau n=1 Tax=Oceanicella actignis TaxID=1189325 RepID=UPI0011E7BA34|nr:DNA polymerase III subunit gamma/tau [Oceanicella actignis]TYO91410.1 DNA polymerase-3 subunit gamma/tau [Oceanicella actignis]